MWLEIAVGALCGFLVGTSGLGGPMLFFPLLVTLFRVPAGDAVAISLAFNAIIRTESLAQHWKEVDWRSAGWLLLGGIPAGIAMVLYVHALHADLLREAAFDRTRIVRSTLTKESGVQGAAALFLYEQGRERLT